MKNGKMPVESTPAPAMPRLWACIKYNKKFAQNAGKNTI